MEYVFFHYFSLSLFSLLAPFPPTLSLSKCLIFETELNFKLVMCRCGQKSDRSCEFAASYVQIVCARARECG